MSKYIHDIKNLHKSYLTQIVRYDDDLSSYRQIKMRSIHKKYYYYDISCLHDTRTLQSHDTL